MTSNIGTKLIQKGVSLGFQSDEKGEQRSPQKRRSDGGIAPIVQSGVLEPDR